jgi:hypothetical protein
MQVPAWLPDSFAGLMIAVSIYCSVVLLTSRRLRRRINVDINIAHVTMGVAMAGMLVPTLTTLPTGLWEAVFVGMGTWFVWRSVRFVARRVGTDAVGDLHHVSHYLTHLVMASGMLYMYLAAPSAAASFGSMSMGGPAGATANFVGMPLLFLIVLSVSAVWHIDTLSVMTSTKDPVLLRARETSDVMSGAMLAGDVEPAMPDKEFSGSNGGVAPDAPAADGRAFAAPRLEMACHVAMCITMGYMLILML